MKMTKALFSSASKGPDDSTKLDESRRRTLKVLATGTLGAMAAPTLGASLLESAHVPAAKKGLAAGYAVFPFNNTYATTSADAAADWLRRSGVLNRFHPQAIRPVNGAGDGFSDEQWDTISSRITNVLIRYPLNMAYPTLTSVDVTQILQDANFLASLKKGLIIQFVFSGFNNNPPNSSVFNSPDFAVAADMNEVKDGTLAPSFGWAGGSFDNFLTLAAPNNGVTGIYAVGPSQGASAGQSWRVKLWLPTIYNALASEFIPRLSGMLDGHPGITTIIFSETAPGQRWQVGDGDKRLGAPASLKQASKLPGDASIESYVKAVTTAFAQRFGSTRTAVMLNFPVAILEGAVSHMVNIEGSPVGIGGPDAEPWNTALQNGNIADPTNPSAPGYVPVPGSYRHYRRLPYRLVCLQSSSYRGGSFPTLKARTDAIIRFCQNKDYMLDGVMRSALHVNHTCALYTLATPGSNYGHFLESVVERAYVLLPEVAQPEAE